ncbi:hypothetical protein PVK06_049956 [Gossypium arboreum]|uniref:Uncharacterized protein n=1 Tax=Gossypium arboreum TaxID=29729 RepID=A0ABR0M9U2_GOSAR|nr:hypothetical protein PVK06_049956 [Gossypium arboreum]
MSVRLKGGLGIRQMNQVNEALLDKTAWRDSVSTESPMITIFKNKKDTSFLRPVSSARVIIDRPTEAMTMHLKPLYIKVHIEGVPVSGVLVDGGAALLCSLGFRASHESLAWFPALNSR